MKQITQTRLNKKLELHIEWLRDNSKGERLVLFGYDLSKKDLTDAVLRGAIMRGVNLTRADLTRADLTRADLRGADLRGADLRGADLRGADLRGADLNDADLRGADLRGADLRGADLRGADLNDCNYDYTTVGFNLACPETGAFIGYAKKSRHILKLEITENALRSSATSRKCRASEIKTLEIINIKTGESIQRLEHNSYGHITVYEVGKITKPDKWDSDRWNECSHGIHFFLTKHEAEMWN